MEYQAVVGTLLPVVYQVVGSDQIIVRISDEVNIAWIRYRIGVSSLNPVKRIRYLGRFWFGVM